SQSLGQSSSDASPASPTFRAGFASRTESEVGSRKTEVSPSVKARPTLHHPGWRAVPTATASPGPRDSNRAAEADAIRQLPEVQDMRHPRNPPVRRRVGGPGGHPPARAKRGKINTAEADAIRQLPGIEDIRDPATRQYADAWGVRGVIPPPE